MTALLFADRRDAGRRLAAALQGRHYADPIVLALPRGGVPVGFEVARALAAPLDVLLVRKIGAPDQPEFGLGAVVDGAAPQVVMDEELVRLVAPPPGYVAQQVERQLAEIERRRRLYGARPPLSLAGRTAIVVDDGIATGGTARAALRAIAALARLRVLAVPVASQDVLDALGPETDEIVCLSRPARLHAVGAHYEDFTQTTDEEVIRLLDEASGPGTLPP